MHYEKENPIDWSSTKCKNWDFKLLLGSANGSNSNEMTYFDSIVRKEHMFLRYIFEKEKLETSTSIKNIINYYKSSKNLSKLLSF